MRHTKTPAYVASAATRLAVVAGPGPRGSRTSMADRKNAKLDKELQDLEAEWNTF